MEDTALHYERPDPQQVEIWRGMTGAQRLGIAFDLWRYARDVVRQSELNRDPDLTETELNRRVAARMSRGTG